MLVAFLNQVAIGTILFSIDNEILNVYGLSIHEDYRRRGFAKELGNYLLNFAKEKNLKAIRCNTMKETGNVEIFQEFGLAIINEKTSILCEGLNGEPIIDVQMELKLTDLF